MTFSIYDDSVGGTLCWSEEQDVAVSCGVFNVTLGKVNSIPVYALQHTNRWLGVKVGIDPEMSPRRQFTSVGYAYHSAYTGIEYGIKPYPEPRTVDIPYPSYNPFQIMISELGGPSDQSAWMSGGENDHYLSYVGIDGSGNVVHGSVSLWSQDTILTVRPGLVLRTKGDGHRILVLDSSEYNLESKAIIITPFSIYPGAE